MDLETFITESLKQIITGIKKAQDFASKNGAKINPKSQQRSEGDLGRDVSYDGNSNTYSHNVKFDLALSATEEKKSGKSGKGQVGISIAKVNGDISSENSQQNALTNRIQFIVPVRFPIQETEEELKEIDKKKPPPHIRNLKKDPDFPSGYMDS